MSLMLTPSEDVREGFVDHKGRRVRFQSTEDFIKSGGQIEQVPFGYTINDVSLAKCPCGCKGRRDRHDPTHPKVVEAARKRNKRLANTL